MSKIIQLLYHPPSGSTGDMLLGLDDHGVVHQADPEGSWTEVIPALKAIDPPTPKATKPVKPSLEVPEPYALDDTFMAIWDDWVDYRKDPQEPGNKMTPRSTAGIFGKFEKSGLDVRDCGNCLNWSMRQGWVGVFPEKYYKDSGTGSTFTLEVED